MRHQFIFLLVFTAFTAPLYAQGTSSTQSIQMDTDWEKIRDAQVQMIKKKEAELDRIKQELLKRAQPQADILPDARVQALENELQTKSAQWDQERIHYENQTALLKQKGEEQKKELDVLREKLSELEKGRPPAAPEVDRAEESRKSAAEAENQLAQKVSEFEKQKAEFLKEKEKSESEIQRQYADLAEQKKRLEGEGEDINRQKVLIQQAGAELEKIERLKNEANQRMTDVEQREKDLAAQTVAVEKERADFEAAKAQWEERRKAEADRIDSERHRWEEQVDVVQNQQSSLSLERKNLDEKIKSVKDREAALQAKQTNLEERELHLVDAQQKLFDEKRAWNTQKVSGDQGLTKKLADAEARLAEMKDAAAEREFNWKKREQDLLKAQDTADRTNFERQEAQRKSEIQDLSQKLAQSENKLKETELRLQEVSGQILKQDAENGKALTDKSALLDRRESDLNQREADLRKKNSDLDAREVQLDEKSKALEKDREQVDAQLQRAEAAGVPSDSESFQFRQQLDQQWAVFVNKETEYQMEIENLKNQNQDLQQKLAGAMAVSAGTEGGRNWSTEARRVVDERRALGEEKARLYRQLTQERQALEQQKVEFVRAQREFQAYVRSEEARLGRTASQAVRH